MLIGQNGILTQNATESAELGEIVKTTEKNNYTDVEENKATVPEEFVVSKIPEESKDDAESNETAEREAVMKYNGFYIGRYEAGVDGTIVISKQNATIYANKAQREFKKISKTMYTGSNVKSAMSSGIPWDMVMKFVDGKNDVAEKIIRAIHLFIEEAIALRTATTELAHALAIMTMLIVATPSVQYFI